MGPCVSILTIAFLALWALSPPASPPKKLTAESFDSGFPLSHATFNGMLAASDGKVYYVLCASTIDTGAQMYSFDPATKAIRHLGDLTEASGEKGLKTIPQGKSHVNFVEWQGKLYFATHVGYYTIQNGMERMGVPPPGYKPYPGGHFLAYDMASGKFENLASAPPEQGILAMNMDVKRGRLYGLTWPSGFFLRFDLASRDLKNLGPTSKEGEGGNGPTYRVLCRSLPVDPEDGSVYFTTADGDILRYRYDRDAIETVQGENMRKDYFGSYNLAAGGRMGYNWRQTFWYPPERAIYGLHGNSGYLFRFDPRVPRVDVIERITSEPSRRSGMYDEFAYGYLSFALGPDGRTVYYLTTGPILDENGRRLAAGRGTRGAPREDLRLVTYDIPAAKYEDHGAILLPDGQRPTLVHSIAVAKDGTVYSLASFRRNGRALTDLIRIRVR
jgi:hypothetical protein